MAKTKWSIFTSKTTVLDVSIKKCSLLQGTTDLYTVFIRISTLGASLISETFSVGVYSSWALIQFCSSLVMITDRIGLHSVLLPMLKGTQHSPLFRNTKPVSAKQTCDEANSNFSNPLR